jgi:SAM-dependent methyltransferase
MSAEQAEKILWRHIRDLPYFRAMLRAVEDNFYQDLELPAPVLDVGCGDGHFASVAFEHPLDVGLDPWSGPLREAYDRHTYRLVIQADGAQTPFADDWFASAVSNSVLEHIPHVDDVIREIARVLKPGGLFVFCVPNDRFTTSLSGSSIFRAIGLNGASEAYSRFFNLISRHAHCDSQEVWRQRLEQFGFTIEKCWDYFPPRSLHVLEAGHFFGLPSLLARRLTGRWILVKNKDNLWLPWLITRPHVLNPISAQGAYSFYIARKKVARA